MTRLDRFGRVQYWTSPKVLPPGGFELVQYRQSEKCTKVIRILAMQMCTLASTRTGTVRDSTGGAAAAVVAVEAPPWCVLLSVPKGGGGWTNLVLVTLELFRNLRVSFGQALGGGPTAADSTRQQQHRRRRRRRRGGVSIDHIKNISIWTSIRNVCP